MRHVTAMVSPVFRLRLAEHTTLRRAMVRLSSNYACSQDSGPCRRRRGPWGSRPSRDVVGAHVGPSAYGLGTVADRGSDEADRQLSFVSPARYAARERRGGRASSP